MVNTTASDARGGWASHHAEVFAAFVGLALALLVAKGTAGRSVGAFVESQAQVAAACVRAAGQACLYRLVAADGESSLEGFVSKIKARAYSRSDLEEALSLVLSTRTNVLDPAAESIQVASIQVPKLALAARGLRDVELRPVAAAIAANYDRMLASADSLLAGEYRHSRALERLFVSLLGEAPEADPAAVAPLDDALRSSWQAVEDCLENEERLNTAFGRAARLGT